MIIFTFVVIYFSPYNCFVVVGILGCLFKVLKISKHFLNQNIHLKISIAFFKSEYPLVGGLLSKTNNVFIISK